MSTVPQDREDRLRDAVARVQEEVGRATSSPALRSAWDGLVGTLALGPRPELRACPICGHSGMRAATRCGYCWAKLAPIVESPISSA
jgi:hypothetical protein